MIKVAFNEPLSLILSFISRYSSLFTQLISEVLNQFDLIEEVSFFYDLDLKTCQLCFFFSFFFQSFQPLLKDCSFFTYNWTQNFPRGKNFQQFQYLKRRRHCLFHLLLLLIYEDYLFHLLHLLIWKDFLIQRIELLEYTNISIADLKAEDHLLPILHNFITA